MVACSQPQRRRIIWYSVTAIEKVGRSNTCTRDATVPGAPANPPPQPRQQGGSTGSRLSGVATGARPLPQCPGCPPCLRRARPAAAPAPADGCRCGDCSPCWPAERLPAVALALAPGPSELGGCEEFEESRPSCRRNASNSTRNASINTACSASWAACSATKAANSPYEGVASGSDTGGVQHDQTADASTDTPQVSRGSDWLVRRDKPLDFRSFWPVATVSGLAAGAGVEDEGVIDALFGGSGLGAEGRGQFCLGVALVAGEVDPDGPAVG